MLVLVIAFVVAGFVFKVNPFILIFMWISTEVPLAIKLEQMNDKNKNK